MKAFHLLPFSQMYFFRVFQKSNKDIGFYEMKLPKLFQKDRFKHELSFLLKKSQ